MNDLILIGTDGNVRGAPQTWAQRLQGLLAARGYRVTAELEADWTAALFITGVSGLDGALQRGRPVAYRVANGYLPEWFRAMGRAMQPEHHAGNAAIARGLQSATTVIYQSYWAKEQLDRFLHPRDSRYAVIPNGVDLAHFSPATEPKTGPPVIGTVGLLRYRYRLETFFELSRRLARPHRLLVVGSLDEECRAMLRQYQADPTIGPRLTYQPFVEHAALPALYRQMSLLVHPVCGDVCPNVVVEALACGVPVVAPRFGGAAELAGEAGAIFDCQPWRYDAAFVAALTAAAESALGQAGRLSPLARLRAEAAFDIQKMVDAYLQALELPATAPQRLADAGPGQQPSTPTLRQQAAGWIARPRFYAALALRKTRQAQRRLFPPPANPRPRIAFSLYDFHVGGIENWLYRLALCLKDRYDFYFLATKVPDFLPKFTRAGRCAYLPGPAEMIRYLQQHNVDILQVHNERWPVDAALAAGVPHVIERTDGTRSCTRVPKHGLKLVIASSQGTVPLIAAGFPPERIHLIYNGLDLDEVDAAPVQRPWDADSFVLGRTSRFGRGKNLSLLIAAVEQLRSRLPQLRLALVGGDSLMPGAEPLEAELRQQAAGLGEAVTFLGYQEHSLPWVKGFDAATCVSNPGNEGIPNSLIEAMACRKPVIATDIDQVGELVKHEENGLLIPPNDLPALCAAIERLAADPALCHRLGEAGRRTVEEIFSLPRAAGQYAALYDSLLRRGA